MFQSVQTQGTRRVSTFPVLFPAPLSSWALKALYTVCRAIFFELHPLTPEQVEFSHSEGRDFPPEREGDTENSLT